MPSSSLDRSRRDSLAVRTIIERLNRGRAIAMFPEGRLTHRPILAEQARLREFEAVGPSIARRIAYMERAEGCAGHLGKSLMLC